jgi:hypothetical protein
MSFKLPSLQNLLPGNVHKRLPQLQQGRSNSRCDTESSISQNSLDQAIWGHLYGAERLMLSTLATLGASMVWVGCSMFKAAVPGLTRKQTPNNTAMTNLLSDAVKIRQTWTDTTASAAGTCANKNLKSTVAKVSTQRSAAVMSLLHAFLPFYMPVAFIVHICQNKIQLSAAAVLFVAVCRPWLL